MPAVGQFEGISLYMYFKDHNPPHVHAFHGDNEVLLVIRDGSVLAGGLPGRHQAAAVAWVVEHTAELAARWEEMQ